jgi:excisionase family DNA binding protein
VTTDRLLRVGELIAVSGAGGSATLSPLMEQRYMTVKDCAAYLGRTVRAIEGLVRRDQIPVIRLGRRVQFDKDRIDRWMQNHSENGSGSRGKREPDRGGRSCPSLSRHCNTY